MVLKLGDVVWYMDENKAIQGFVSHLYGNIKTEGPENILISVDYGVVPIVGPLSAKRMEVQELFQTKKELLDSL